MMPHGGNELVQQESHLNDQFGTGGNRPLSTTTSNTTFELAANNFLLGAQPQQVTPAEVLPVNWLNYLIDSLPSGEFEDAVERFEEEARKRFKRQRLPNWKGAVPS